MSKFGVVTRLGQGYRKSIRNVQVMRKRERRTGRMMVQKRQRYNERETETMVERERRTDR